MLFMKIGADPAIDLPTATQPSHWQQRDPSKIKSDHHLCLMALYHSQI